MVRYLTVRNGPGKVIVNDTVFLCHAATKLPNSIYRWKIVLPWTAAAACPGGRFAPARVQCPFLRNHRHSRRGGFFWINWFAIMIYHKCLFDIYSLFLSAFIRFLLFHPRTQHAFCFDIMDCLSHHSHALSNAIQFIFSPSGVCLLFVPCFDVSRTIPIENVSTRKLSPTKLLWQDPMNGPLLISNRIPYMEN